MRKFIVTIVAVMAVVAASAQTSTVYIFDWGGLNKPDSSIVKCNEKTMFDLMGEILQLGGKVINVSYRMPVYRRCILPAQGKVTISHDLIYPKSKKSMNFAKFMGMPGGTKLKDIHKAVELDLLPGETYYIEIKMSPQGTKEKMKVITEQDAQKLLEYNKKGLSFQQLPDYVMYQEEESDNPKFHNQEKENQEIPDASCLSVDSSMSTSSDNSTVWLFRRGMGIDETTKSMVLLNGEELFELMGPSKGGLMAGRLAYPCKKRCLFKGIDGKAILGYQMEFNGRGYGDEMLLDLSDGTTHYIKIDMKGKMKEITEKEAKKMIDGDTYKKLPDYVMRLQ